MDLELTPTRYAALDVAYAPNNVRQGRPRRRWGDGPRLTTPQPEDEQLRGLRLAIVTDTYVPQVNGVARTMERLADAAREVGAEVMVFTTTDPDARDDRQVQRFRSVPFWAYPQLRIGYPGARAMEAALRLWRPSLVHVATPFGLGLAARAASARLDIPLVSSYHTSLTAYANHYGLGALARPGWLFLRWFHNGAARTYCPSKAVRDDLQRRGFRNTALWPRGVDAALFNPAHRSDDLRRTLGVGERDVLVGYVGRVAREKGIDDLMRAVGSFNASSTPAVRLVIIGDGPYLERCRRESPAGAIFVGRKSGTELAQLYASLDLFVFPSVTDTFGNVLLESMASGVAIIAADSRTTREVVGDHAAGWYAPNDHVQLAGLIAELAADEGRRARIAREARAASSGRDWEAVMTALFADYRLIASAGDGPPPLPPAA